MTYTNSLPICGSFFSIHRKFQIVNFYRFYFVTLFPHLFFFLRLEVLRHPITVRKIIYTVISGVLSLQSTFLSVLFYYHVYSVSSLPWTGVGNDYIKKRKRKKKVKDWLLVTWNFFDSIRHKVVFRMSPFHWNSRRHVFWSSYWLEMGSGVILWFWRRFPQE